MSPPARHYLDFEKPVADLEAKIEELSKLSESAGAGVSGELQAMRLRVETLRGELYGSLDPWKKTQVARHPGRPHFRDYVDGLVEDFVELRGDRKFGDDQAIIGGLGRFRGQGVVLLGHEKGADTQSRLKHNFGMARPEGLPQGGAPDGHGRAVRPAGAELRRHRGAYPGVGAEERGQAEAIARSTERCLTLGVPMIATITGEGGSGGAIAIAAANKVLILEHSIYSGDLAGRRRLHPLRDGGRAREAASAMKITAQDLIEQKVVDRIVPEPAGGAHSDPDAIVGAVGEALDEDCGASPRFPPTSSAASARTASTPSGRT
jgi:acetyl-CoA carboxylase carboxyl transferase subunit alpha